MAQPLEIKAENRDDFGKAASRRLRRLHDKFPAILYGGDEKPMPLSIEHNHILKVLENESVFSQILDININGKTVKAVLKDIQRHPYKPKIEHMDFMRVNATEKLHMNIPIHFLNEDTAPGVKEGGVISHHMIDIEVTCLAKDLPEYIEVDIANLEMHGSIHLSEITLPQGVESVALSHGEDHDEIVVSIHEPQRITPEEEAEAAAAEEAAAETTAASEEEASSTKEGGSDTNKENSAAKSDESKKG